MEKVENNKETEGKIIAFDSKGEELMKKNGASIVFDINIVPFG